MENRIISILPDALSGFFIFLYFSILTGRAQSKRRLFIIGLIMSLSANVLLGPLFAKLAAYCSIHGISYLFLNSFLVSILAAVITKLFFPMLLKDFLFPLACSYALYSLIYLFSFSFASQTIYPLLQMYVPASWNLYLIFMVPFLPLAACTATLMRTWKCQELIVYYNNKGYPLKKTLLFSLALFLLQGTLHVLSGNQSYRSQYFIVIGLLCLLFFLMMAYLIQRLHLVEEKARNAQAALAWQDTYNRTLEDLQKELRNFRHDYKNMLSSLLLKAEDGTMDPAGLSDLFLDFDTHIAEKMKLSTQLSNIGIIETKSLLMNKLTLISSRKLPVTFEVLYPFDHVNMPLIDFNRCLGILLDNAIEEVSAHGGDLSIILLKEEKDLLVMIENSISHDVDIDALYEDGYSTKGKSRGIGLSSYRAIIEKYDHVYGSTLCRNGRFLQELRIT